MLSHSPLNIRPSWRNRLWPKEAARGFRRGLVLLAAAGMLLTASVSGMTVTQNAAPGATSWPGSPIIGAVANPAGSATVAESFGASQNYGQTFTVPAASYLLDRISLYVGNGSGTGGAVTLGLYDLGTQTAPNPNAYAPGTNLFGSGNGLPLAYAAQSPGVLQLDFSGVERVTLLAGHMYAFELQGVSGTSPLYWYRSAADTYADGAAYRNRAWINGNNARDFALALYGTVTATPPAICDITWNDPRQTIDGFGAGVVFLDAGLDPITNANADTLFGTASTGQLGLTLMRVRIAPNESWANSTAAWATALSDAGKAAARGARVLATPWTPPASMKDNASTIQGSLLPAQYASYASYLNKFAGYLKNNGVQLAAVSLQNEPDWAATYESCLWTAAQFADFCANHAGAITNAPVMMPESLNFSQAMSNTTLNNAAAAANVSFVGGHLYGGTIQDYPLARNLGKRIWMTEYLINDQTWGSALSTAQQVHDCLAVGNMSAYIWWKCLGDINGLLNAAGVPQKRGFVMAQFSRFIRPGFVRLGTSNPTQAASVSAYKNPATGDFVVVAINGGSTPVAQTFNLGGLALSAVTPWVTSATLSLASQAPIAVTGSSFTHEIPAASVVTYVGSATPLQTLAQWQAASFSGQTDVAVIGATADPDHDGYPNLIEYFMGTPASSRDAAGLATAALDATGTNLVLTFRMAKYLSGVSHTIQQSSDLLTWTDTGVAASLAGDQGGYLLMHASVPAGPSKLFLRLAVTVP